MKLVLKHNKYYVESQHPVSGSGNGIVVSSGKQGCCINVIPFVIWYLCIVFVILLAIKRRYRDLHNVLGPYLVFDIYNDNATREVLMVAKNSSSVSLF